MKKIIYGCAALLMLAACAEDKFNYGKENTTGTLSFEGMSIGYSTEMNKVTKAGTSEEADDAYELFLYDSSNSMVWQKSYGEVKTSTNGVSLPAGNYSLEVRSTVAPVPAAKFAAPVYGATKSFTINVGQTTNLGTITCYLLQSAVTVGYNDDFLATVTGDGNTSVEVTSGSPLDYALTYGNGTPTYDRRLGYFAINNGAQTSMTVTFKGSIDGKTQKMTTSITPVKARDWHIITFMKKVDETGNAVFSIEIDGLVEDLTLENDILAAEEGDGNDPKAPQGDGGITLVSTCSYDITAPITVPAVGTAFPLTMTANIPNGARKFTVLIESDNTDFMNSVNTVGGNLLDLINPTEASLGIFDIVPFPHGSSLLNSTAIKFDLSGAQTPILAFPGTHTFTMQVTDNKGCRKSIAITLFVAGAATPAPSND